MNENTRILIGFACGALTFLYFFIFVFLKGRTFGNKFRERALRDGTVVTAHSVKSIYLQDIRNGLDGVRVTYAYTVGGKKYRKRILWEFAGTSSDHPTSLEIFYCKSAPWIAYTSADFAGNHQKGVGCIASIIVPILVIIVATQILKWI